MLVCAVWLVECMHRWVPSTFNSIGQHFQSTVLDVRYSFLQSELRRDLLSFRHPFQRLALVFIKRFQGHFLTFPAFRAPICRLRQHRQIVFGFEHVREETPDRWVNLRSDPQYRQNLHHVGAINLQVR